MCELHNAGLWAFDECNEYLDFQGLAYFHKLYGQGISDAAQPLVRTERRVDVSARCLLWLLQVAVIDQC